MWSERQFRASRFFYVFIIIEEHVVAVVLDHEKHLGVLWQRPNKKPHK